MTKTIFNRLDPEVKKDAGELTQEEFLAKYEGKTTPVALKTVWNAANKGKAVEKEVKTKTDEANDFPVSAEFKAEDGDKVKVSKDPATKTVRVEAEPTKDSTEVSEKPEKEKKEKKEKAPKDDSKPSRADRIRTLIAEKKDKAAVIVILKEEGYDTKTVHSEWNRLNK